MHPIARLAALATLALLVPATSVANHSFPATYTGTAASGGTVEFDVSADGSAVTRFMTSMVPTSCGTIGSTSTGTFAITNHAFTWSPPSGTRFSGTFTGPQQASGTLGIKLPGFPSCTSADVNWSATTTAPPPGPPPPTGPPPPGPPPPGPAPPPPPGPDTVAPELALSGARSPFQGRRSDAGVVAVCRNEPCRFLARGTVSVPGAAKVFRLKGLSRSAAQGVPQKLALRMPAAAQRAVRKALKAGKRVTAKVSVTATDIAGNSSTRTRAFRVRES